MGLEDEIEVTDDIGTADAIIASSSEMKQNPWIRGVAKFHLLPIFVMKVCIHVFLDSLLVCIYVYICLHTRLCLIEMFGPYCSQTLWHKWSRQFV